MSGASNVALGAVLAYMLTNESTPLRYEVTHALHAHAHGNLDVPSLQTILSQFMHAVPAQVTMRAVQCASHGQHNASSMAALSVVCTIYHLYDASP